MGRGRPARDGQDLRALIVGGVRCHGGFDGGGADTAAGVYRVPAIDSWQRNHVAAFGTDLIDVPLSTWPETYPNVDQAKFLIAAGVREPIVTTLTRIGTVEGFGAMIRYANVGDPQRYFDESVAGTAPRTCTGVCSKRTLATKRGSRPKPGTSRCGSRRRDVALEHPVTEDETGGCSNAWASAAAATPDPQRIRRQMEKARAFADLDLDFEMLIQRMINILLIEISAFHTFAWAETVLSDTDLVAGEAAARLVSYIRQDETPHVEYLKTALTEMRERTFVGESGRKYPGTEIVGTLWERGLTDLSVPGASRTSR